MHGYFSEWLILVMAMTIGVMSPGPDFIITLRNALAYGRTTGLWTAMGLAGGVGVHVTYNLVGIAALIAHSVILFNIIKFAGAGYLLYIGVQALRSQGMRTDPALGDVTIKTMSDMSALRSGFVTNVLNPKATLFFLALFSQIISPETTMSGHILYAATCVTITGLWFSTISLFLTTPAIRNRFLKISKWIDRTCGAVFIALGLKLALTKAPV